MSLIYIDKKVIRFYLFNPEVYVQKVQSFVTYTPFHMFTFLIFLKLLFNSMNFNSLFYSYSCFIVILVHKIYLNMTHRNWQLLCKLIALCISLPLELWSNDKSPLVNKMCSVFMFVPPCLHFCTLDLVLQWNGNVCQ